MEEKEEVINSYMKFRAIECKNKDALVNYERYLRRFLKGVDNKLSNLDETYLIDKVNNFSDDFSQTTINVIKPLLKNFIKWKYVDYPVKFRNLDKICRTKRAKATYSAKQMLKESEVKKIIETETDLFWKVFWMVFFYGGMRGIDTIRLKWDMFDFSQKDDIIIIKTFIGKNKKEFYKGLPAELTPIIKKWKDVNPSEWVFPSPQGDHPIHPKTPNKRLERVSKKALGKSINPYILRHSLGSIKYNEDGIDKDIIADQMGHSIDMSGVYTHLNEDEMVARAKKVWTNKKEMPKKEKDLLLKRIELLEKSNKGFRKMLDEELADIRKQHKLKVTKEVKEMAKRIK